jgi:hypothetical protein
VGSVAGLWSPALLDLFDVSMSSGTNLLRGFGIASLGKGPGINTGVGSGVGNGLIGPLLLLNVVSTGSGIKRRLAGGNSASPVASPAFRKPSFLLLLLVVVSTGSTANRRTFFTVVSTGVGENRLEVGGGESSDIVLLEKEELADEKSKPDCCSVPSQEEDSTHSKPNGLRACDQSTVCSLVARAFVPSGQ